jgi:PKD repeat protein
MGEYHLCIFHQHSKPLNMIRYLTLLIVATLGFSLSLVAQSNLFIDNSYTAEEMVDAFFMDSEVIPSNVSFTGNNLGMAFFDAGDTDMDIDAGIFLSTGIVFEAANTASFFASTSLGSPGDTDLEAQVNDGFPSFDASVLEMDITPFTDTICFFYVFASEEYPEWVFSSFNDVFAFFISGGPEYDTLTNIATIPNTDPGVAVSINTINQNLFSNYYIPQYNNDPTDLSYDGMTVLLPAKAYVTPGETYHIKIGITDVSDAIYDSGVFIGIQSLGGDSLLTPIANATLTVEENSLSVENESMFAKEFYWDFGDGTTTSERHPEPHIYEEEGTYNVALTVSSWCCSATYTEVIEIGSAAAPVAAFSASEEEVCVGSEIIFSDLSTGDIASWEWTFPGGNPASSTEPSPTVTYEEPGTYNVQLLVTAEDGQSAAVEMSELLHILPAPEATFESIAQELSVALQNTSTHAVTYLWDFGDGNQSEEANPIHQYENPGSYTITLYAYNDCGESTVSTEVNLVVNNTLEKNLHAFEVFPNPVKNLLTIEPGTYSGVFDFALYSSEGRLILKQAQVSGVQRIELEHLNAGGVYLLEVRSAQGTYNKIIIKE